MFFFEYLHVILDTTLWSPYCHLSVSVYRYKLFINSRLMLIHHAASYNGSVFIVQYERSSRSILIPKKVDHTVMWPIMAYDPVQTLAL